MKLGIVFVIVAGVLLACGNDTPMQPEYPLESEFTIDVGETVAVGETLLRITFNRVTQDSRCPLEAVCFWPGNGEAELRLQTTRQDTMTAVLNTFLAQHDAVFEGYRVILTNLQPYPQDGKEIDPADYIATLKVEIYRNSPAH